MTKDPWTLATLRELLENQTAALREHVDAQHADLMRLLDERNNAQASALRAAEASARQAASEAVSDGMRDVTSRLDLMTGQASGSSSRKSEGRLDLGSVVGLVGGLVAVAALIIMLVGQS